MRTFPQSYRHHCVNIACIFIGIFHLSLTGCAQWRHFDLKWNCRGDGISQALACLDAMERHANEFGGVVVGAPRISDYNSEILNVRRKLLTSDLQKIREELLTVPPVTAEEINRQIQQLSIKLLASIKAEDILSNIKDSGTHNINKTIDDLQRAGDSLSISVPYQLSAPRMGMTGLRIAEMRYLESELEDIQLAEFQPLDKNYRRIILSVSLTAWMRGETQASVVLLDLYPYDADLLCHEGGHFIKDYQKTVKVTGINPEEKIAARKDLAKKWWSLFKQKFPKLIVEAPSGFPWFIERALENSDINSAYTLCHAWVSMPEIAPRLIHVERLGEAEHRVAAGLRESSTELDTNVHTPSFFGSLLGVATQHSKEESYARKEVTVQPLNIAFAAGFQRAGWFFMPHKESMGHMGIHPVERRLRMVVDIPKGLTHLSLFAHKMFLNGSLEPIPASSFSHQMRHLNYVQTLLNRVEQQYECIGEHEEDLASESKTAIALANDHLHKCNENAHHRANDPEDSYPSKLSWSLVKSRLRNLLHQGWSERLIIVVPPEAQRTLATMDSSQKTK